MKYVLADITRRNISFHYYQERNGNRAFVPFGTNGPIPLAISYANGRYSIGKPAQLASEAGQKEAYYNLFDENDTQKRYCDGLRYRQLVPMVIAIMLGDLCGEKFYTTLEESSNEITMALLYGNDITLDEIENVRSVLMRDAALAEVKVFDHSQEAVKFFHPGVIDDWSGETDGMVVMSDNEDLSIKCYTLSDYKLKYEHRFKGKGTDPRFEWAVNMLWKTVKDDTYCTVEDSLPVIKKNLKYFLDSSDAELNTVKLSDGNNYQVHLTRRQYDIYSPPGGNQFVTIAGDVVRKADLSYKTTGIVLQGYAADNKSFRDSFVSFDPISNENESITREIYNNILSVLLGDGIEPEVSGVTCPWNGTTLMVGVKTTPANQPFTATTDDLWLKTLVGPKEVAIIAGPNDGPVERVGVVTLTSPYKRVTKTIVVRQPSKDTPPPCEVVEKSVTLPWNGGSHDVEVKMSVNHKFTAVANESWIKVAVGSGNVTISADSNEGASERKGVVTLSCESATKTIEVIQPDNGNRKFNITYKIVRSGFFGRTKKLTVNVEILDGKALPFDCVFTLTKEFEIGFNPNTMYYEDCERGAKGTLTFGPYTLPFAPVGNTNVINAGIWPARQMPGNPLFSNNQKKIKL